MSQAIPCVLPQRRVLDLVDRIYAAAELPDEWRATLDAIAEALQAEMTVLFYQDVNRTCEGVVATTRVDATLPNPPASESVPFALT